MLYIAQVVYIFAAHTRTAGLISTLSAAYNATQTNWELLSGAMASLSQIQRESIFRTAEIEYQKHYKKEMNRELGNYWKGIKDAADLMAISFPNEPFEGKLKDLIYIETMLFGSYKKYFGLFLTFYKEELNQNDQIKIEFCKKIAENYLALIDKVSFASMHNTTVLQNILTENKARRLNDKVFTFLKAHPLLHTFRNSKALDDLRKVTEK